jgi:hypothetical protein
MADPIVGDSFGGIQQSQLQQEGLRRAAFAQSMANILGSLRERNNLALATHQQELEQGYHKAQMEHAERELDLRNHEALWRNQRDIEHNKISQGYLDMQNKMLDWQKTQPTSANVREQAFQDAQAERLATQGYFDDPAHVQSVYPHMSEAQAGLLADESYRARSQLESDYNTANEAAGTLNRQMELTKSIASTKSAVAKVPWYRGMPTELQTAKENLPQLQAELGDVSNRANKIQQDKRLAGLVTYDPQSGKYMPTVPTPQWQNRQRRGNGSLNTGSTGTSSAPTPEDQAGGVGGGLGGLGANPGVTPTTGTGSTGRKYPMPVYDLVNRYVSQGMHPSDALSMAISDYGQSTENTR